MKKIILTILCFILFTGCFGDRLQPIRALGRSENIDKKTEASILYQEAIKTMMEAYNSSFGINKDIGTRLMNTGGFEKAIEHFKIAASIKNNDRIIYHNIGICYINLYKINKNDEYLTLARNNYEIALNLAPDTKGLLYDYAQLLIFGYEDYTKAIEVLNHYVYKLGALDKDGYFLLGRSYYAVGEFDKAYSVFSDIYQFEKKLSDDEKVKLTEFLAASSKKE